MNKPARKRRVFFALWPDTASREQLVKLQEDLNLQGRKTAPFNLHVTLEFIGAVDQQQLDCLLAIGSDQSAKSLPSAFDLILDKLSYFKRPKVVLLEPQQMPAELLLLHRELLDVLSANCAHQPEKRQYRPHLTLSRHSKPADVQPFKQPVSIPVTHFVLCESVPVDRGVEYRILRKWDLPSV